MGQRLEGKKILATASGQGIGKAAALAFSREGAQVLATDINEEALAALKSEAPSIEIAPLNVCDAEAIASMAASHTDIDVLFNCVGYVHHGTILDCEEADWQRSIDLNVTSMYRMTRAFLPGMVAHGGGSIVNVASVASSVTGVPNRFAYGTTKAAVIGLTKAVAADFVGQGIRVNAICPGTVESPSLEDRIRAQGDYEEIRKAFVARQPMGRIGTPEEIAALAVYLAADESGYTTGAIHVIDGGWCI
ncbi:SDR family oxidoreductase [Aeoliella mucimassa]|uniref:2-keto-3-deoxy-L-fuconate dehydrogenase n=1 Tax=Aeoliella mucimassa TaxID=2527972 RepID=A0A518AQH2_9BACT|nr:SDR family oxidoreductase [Aeoliella mucimassa]QDU56969.1 2-keto-3-deoxy-L-fuconate dehydrogenase [Aeoliella mucimassa]